MREPQVYGPDLVEVVAGATAEAFRDHPPPAAVAAPEDAAPEQQPEPPPGLRPETRRETSPET